MNQLFYKNFIKSLSSLISAPSVQGEALPNAPFGAGCRKALDIALDLCRNMGYTTRDLDGYVGVAEVGEGEPFAILGHLDVVPTGDGWDSDPYTLTERDGVLYGRGIADDKGPLLMCIYAVKDLLEQGLVPKRKIRIIMGLNEESGWKCIEHYNEVETMPEEGISPDADFPVVYGEKGILHLEISVPTNTDRQFMISGGMRPNMVADKCKITYTDGEEVVFLGKASHGSQPALGDNAILKALEYLSNEYGGRYTDLHNVLSSLDGTNARNNYTDESGSTTLCTGIISGDNKAITITIDIRYPVTTTSKWCIDQLSSVLPYASIKSINDQLPLYVDKDSALVRTLLSAYNDVTGTNAKPICIGGGTYARALKRGVAFGCEFPHYDNRIHQANERMSIDNLKLTYDIYLEAIKRICF